MKTDLLADVMKFKKGYLSKRELLSRLNSVILSIPSFFRCYDKDIRHDFYACVISKIDRILKGYKNTGEANFKTWLITVLKRNFITFLRLKNRKENKFFDFESYWNYKLYYESENYDNDKDDNEEIKSSLEILSGKEKEVLAHKYGYKLINADINETAEIILKKMERRKILGHKIEKRFMKELLLEKKISEEFNEDAREKLILLNDANKKFKKKLEDEYKSFKIYPSNRWVGLKLGMQEGTIAAYLNRIKSKLAKNLKKVSGL